jgi:Ice-binding-like
MYRNKFAKSKLSLLITSGAALLLSLTACGNSNSTTSGGSGPVGLGAAGTFVILAMSAITTVPASIVRGDVGISPAAASYIDGFALAKAATNDFATSAQVTGKVYAANYAPPTPANMTTAVANMQTAFTDAAGRAPGHTELYDGNIGGKTLTAGVYKWGTDLLIPTDVTLSGSATDVWIFQIAQKLTVSNGVKVNLSGGALAKNIFWQVSGAVTLGTTSTFEGVVLGKTAITAQTGAVVHGRLLAQTAVTIDHATVTDPG